MTEQGQNTKQEKYNVGTYTDGFISQLVMICAH